MGDLMLQVGRCNQVEEIYSQLLKDFKSDGDREFIYHQLTPIRKDRRIRRISFISTEIP